LYRERLNLRAEFETVDDKVDIGGLEDEFVSIAASYSTRRRISYAAWREAGVDAAVLRKAGITRSM